MRFPGRKMLKAALLLAVSGFPATSFAGSYIVTSATITAVISTSGNTAAFVVETQGGTRTCTGGIQITFNQSDSPDADTFKRAYAAALVALTTGIHVTIYNYQASTCGHASYLQLGP
jgi:hypothetical protein